MFITKKRQRIFIYVFITLFVSLLNPLILKAHLPVESLIYYQQKLIDNNGNPITAPTNVKLSIYHHIDDEQPDWTEVYDQLTGDCAKLNPNKKGVVDIKLGSCVAFPNIYTEIKNNHGEFYLGVTINDQSEIVPRINIGDLFLTADSFVQNAQVLGDSTIPASTVKKTYSDSNLLGGGNATSTSKSTKTIDKLILGNNNTVDTNQTTITQPVAQTTNTPESTIVAANAVEGNFSANNVNILDLLENTELKIIKTSQLEVTNSALFNGDIFIKGAVTFNADTVGQAEILRGNSFVRIAYANEYLHPPIVTLTPIGLIEANSYYLTDSDKTGFTIKLTSKANDNLLFNWHAFASDKEKLYVSNGFLDPLNDPECNGYSWIRGFDQNHSGADLAVYKGCPIEAVAAGTVIFARFEETSGYTVKIDHGDGVISRYYHGDGTFWVNESDHVEAGQRIMMMGESGNATGVHLHLELSVDGFTVDPALYIPFKR